MNRLEFLKTLVITPFVAKEVITQPVKELYIDSSTGDSFISGHWQAEELLVAMCNFWNSEIEREKEAIAFWSSIKTLAPEPTGYYYYPLENLTWNGTKLVKKDS